MNKVAYAASLMMLTASLAALQRAPSHGGRYDQQILAEVLKVTGSSKEYKNVRSAVEDGVVTLTGTVKRESLRVMLASRVRRIERVTEVRNQVLLDPPPEPDQVLWSRVRSRIDDAGFKEIQIKVHNGTAVLTGIVRNQKELRRVLQAARLTQGVREVESHVSTAED